MVTRSAVQPADVGPELLARRVGVDRGCQRARMPDERLRQGEVYSQSGINCDPCVPKGVESLQEGERRSSSSAAPDQPQSIPPDKLLRSASLLSTTTMEYEGEVCPFCTGTGHCYKCSGTGARVTQKRGLRSARSVECRVCEGSGKCQLCSGAAKRQPQG